MFKIRLAKSLKSLCFLELNRPIILKCFFAPGDLNPLKSLEIRLSEVRKNTFGRNFSSLLGERERRATPGRHRQAGSGAGSGARWPGGIGGSNRRIEADYVRPSSPVAHRAADRMTDRRRIKAGRVEGFRTAPRLFLCLVLFSGGASAGRGRRTSGVDGADIGRGVYRVKEFYRKKGNIFKRLARRSLPYGGAGRQGWRATQDCVAHRAAFRRGI